jgi:hypothetical protein
MGFARTPRTKRDPSDLFASPNTLKTPRAKHTIALLAARTLTNLR